MTTDTNTQHPDSTADPSGAAPAGGTGSPEAAPQTASSDASPGTQPATNGRSAEARELERQLDQLRQQLQQADERARENLDRWQRAQADLANFRRRTQFEREEQEKYATASLIAALLPVLDSFDRAWGSLPGQFRRLTWLSGVAMIHSQLRGTLERIGLAEIDCDGRPFDPSLHEAVEHEAGDGTPHVVAVLQAGYKLHERVLRPALVKVGPKPATEPATEADSDVRVSGAESTGEDQGAATPQPGADESDGRSTSKESEGQ
ncbi:MAG: nucleotide exchange factor GrpE [Chloroflexota bacterium]